MIVEEMKTEKITIASLQSALKNYSGQTRWNEVMAPYTSLKVGGPADVMLLPKSIEEVSSLMQIISKHQFPYFVLGNGSNLLIKDGGIEGIVIHLKYLHQVRFVDQNHIYVEAGLPYPKLAIYAMEQGLTGLEFAAGIPGTVGGAIVMNAGIPDFETAAHLESITIIRESSGQQETIPAKEHLFSYRRSELPKGIIVSGIFSLMASSKKSIELTMKTYLKKRQDTQPLSFSNCGSVFKNPENHHAGALIESAGLKGLQIGGAQISERHGNFVINRDAASAADFLALIQKMKSAIFDSKGIPLECEVKIIGRD